MSLVLLLLAVAAGVAFQAPNRANLAGFRSEIMEQEVSSGLGHVRIRPRTGDRFHDTGRIVDRVRGLPDVEDVQPMLLVPGAVKKGGRLIVLPITGVKAEGAHRPYELTSGQDLLAGDSHGLLLGERVARHLGVKVGEQLNVQALLATRPRLVLDDGGVGSYDLTVRGLVGFASTDSLFVDWAFLSEETGESEAATIIVVRSRRPDVAGTRGLASRIDRIVPEGSALSWIDDSRYLRSVVQALEAVEAIAGGMSLFGVSIPVLALLYIDALHRRRQVSLLVAIGFRTREIFVIFLEKALMVGLVGVTVGAATALGIVSYFARHPIYDYERFVIRPSLSPGNLWVPVLTVLITTLLAGSLPAWQAARVDPSSTLRRIE